MNKIFYQRPISLFKAISFLVIVSFIQSQNIIDAYLIGNYTTTLMGTQAQGLILPRDLDFHKDVERQNELWVINENNLDGRNHGGSTVTYYDAGQETQWAEYRKYSYSGHFMNTSSAIAMSKNGTFGNPIDC